MTRPNLSSLGEPAHSLDYWMSPELAAITPSATTSRLRQLADGQAARAAGWSVAIGLGPLLIATGLFASVVSDRLPWALAMGPVGAGLTVLGTWSFRRVRARVPDTSRIVAVRGPGSATQGIVMVLVVAGIVGGLGASELATGGPRTTPDPVLLIGAYAIFVAFLVVSLAVPGAVLRRSRPSFRRRVATDPVLRTAVEQDLATWRDRSGRATGYGPL